MAIQNNCKQKVKPLSKQRYIRHNWLSESKKWAKPSCISMVSKYYNKERLSNFKSPNDEKDLDLNNFRFSIYSFSHRIMVCYRYTSVVELSRYFDYSDNRNNRSRIAHNSIHRIMYAHM